MSKEEKKAIDYLKNDVVYWLDKGKDFVVIDIGENDKLHSILNLIEHQQKEIERLKFGSHMIGKWNEYLDKECISKDKIREKIEKAKEINWHTPKLVIEYFEELFEED